jgi:hypothetical protein
MNECVFLQCDENCEEQGLVVVVAYGFTEMETVTKRHSGEQSNARSV